MKDIDPLLPVFWLAGALVGYLILKALDAVSTGGEQYDGSRTDVR